MPPQEMRRPARRLSVRSEPGAPLQMLHSQRPPQPRGRPVAGAPGFSDDSDEVSTSSVAILVIFFLATSPYDFQATTVRPMDAANSNATNAPIARLAIEAPPREANPSTEAGRNVVSTGGAVGPDENSGAARVWVSER